MVRAKRLELLRQLRHWNPNPARLPIPPRPLIRCGGPRNKHSPSTTNYLIRGIESEITTQLLNVAFGTYVVLGQFYLAVFIDDDGRTDQADIDLAVVLLLAPGAISFGHGVVFIRQDREVQVLLRGKFFETCDGVGGDPQHGVAVSGEALQTVTEVAGLGGAARGHGL